MIKTVDNLDEDSLRYTQQPNTSHINLTTAPLTIQELPLTIHNTNYGLNRTMQYIPDYLSSIPLNDRINILGRYVGDNFTNEFHSFYNRSGIPASVLYNPYFPQYMPQINSNSHIYSPRIVQRYQTPQPRPQYLHYNSYLNQFPSPLITEHCFAPIDNSFRSQDQNNMSNSTEIANSSNIHYVNDLPQPLDARETNINLVNDAQEENKQYLYPQGLQSENNQSIEENKNCEISFEKNVIEKSALHQKESSSQGNNNETLISRFKNGVNEMNNYSKPLKKRKLNNTDDTGENFQRSRLNEADLDVDNKSKQQEIYIDKNIKLGSESLRSYYKTEYYIVDKYIQIDNNLIKEIYKDVITFHNKSLLNEIIVFSISESYESLATVQENIESTNNIQENETISSVNEKLLKKFNIIRKFIIDINKDLFDLMGIENVKVLEMIERDNNLKILIEQVYLVVTYIDLLLHSKKEYSRSKEHFKQLNHTFINPLLLINSIVSESTAYNTDNLRGFLRFYQCLKLFKSSYATLKFPKCVFCGLVYCPRTKLSRCDVYDREMTEFIGGFNISLTLNTKYTKKMINEDKNIITGDDAQKNDTSYLSNIFKALMSYNKVVLESEEDLYKIWKGRKRTYYVQLPILKKQIANNLFNFIIKMKNAKTGNKITDLEQNNSFMKNFITINSYFLLKKLISYAGLFLLRDNVKKKAIDYSKLGNIISKSHHQDSEYKNKLCSSLLVIYKSLVTRKICCDYFKQIFELC